jgi:hypothetical protein
MMKRILIALAVLALLIPHAWVGPSVAADQATPEEVYHQVVAAAEFLARHGEAGLVEFKKAKGRFVWKDAYVWVTRCENNTCFPNPKANYIGLVVKEYKCHRTDKFFVLELCEKMKKHPEGAWSEYWWTPPKAEEPQRRVSFMKAVPGQPYQVIAGTYAEKITLAELNQLIR